MERKPDLIGDLRQIVGEASVLGTHSERLAYHSDAYPLEKSAPLCTVLPGSTLELSECVAACHRHSIPYAARGAGTGLAGGALSLGGVVIGVARMNRITDIDLRNRTITAGAGAVNVMLSKAVRKSNLHYAPDPSSQGASTIGGNIANNAGGPHTLKYGVTVNHTLALDLVLPGGEVLSLGDKTCDVNGYDLVGVLCGSEGTMGIVAEATLRLTPLPQSVRTLLAIFDTPDDATRSVSQIIAAGITPAALEMMDRTIIQTVEEAFHFGFPRDAGAVLIIEIDGLEAGLERQALSARQVCLANHCRELREATDAVQRAHIWSARKKAVGTLGRLAPSCVTQDGVIPRSTLPEVLRKISQIGTRYGLRIANVFHAGDGNLHPVVLFDERDPEEVSRVVKANQEILELCIGVGGTITGEHGIGLEKRDFMPLLFEANTLDTMKTLRDCFDPTGLCNPGKVLPSSHGCSFEITSKHAVNI